MVILSREACVFLNPLTNRTLWIDREMPVRDLMRMEFGEWSVAANGHDVIYCMWSRRERGPYLDVALVLGTREGDRRVDVCCDRLQRDFS